MIDEISEEAYQFASKNFDDFMATQTHFGNLGFAYTKLIRDYEDKLTTKEESMLTNEKLDELLAASPAERVTKEYMESRITSVDFKKMSDTLTHCTILLDNRYQITGESACVNPENYNKEIGEKIAHDNAFNKLWPLFGFLLAEKNKLKAYSVSTSAEAA